MICKSTVLLFVLTQEDFSNNKNITRDNRHPSVLFFFTQEDIGCNKITIKDNRQGVCFWGLFLRGFCKFFWGNHCHWKLFCETILKWRNHKIDCCYRLTGFEKRLTNQDYRLILKTIMLLQTNKYLKVKIWKY